MQISDAALGRTLRELRDAAEINCSKCLSGPRGKCWAHEKPCLLDATLDIYNRAVKRARRRGEFESEFHQNKD